MIRQGPVSVTIRRLFCQNLVDLRPVKIALDLITVFIKDEGNVAAVVDEILLGGNACPITIGINRFGDAPVIDIVGINGTDLRKEKGV